MGLGDWIMATADAKEVNERHNVRVVFGDGQNRFYDEVFDRNPRIAKELRQGERFAWVKNYPGRRPYIKEITKERFIFHPDFKAKAGELFPKSNNKNGYVIIEPNVKQNFWIGKNKDWGIENWRALVSKLDCDWRQIGTDNFLDKHHALRTKSITDAISVLAGAKLLITTDGALHHAAAALGIPAIVLWGGMASPTNLGYDSHINLWHGDEPCGSHSKKCMHCYNAMRKITVDEVLESYERSQRDLATRPRETPRTVRKGGEARKVDISSKQTT